MKKFSAAGFMTTLGREILALLFLFLPAFIVILSDYGWNVGMIWGLLIFENAVVFSFTYLIGFAIFLVATYFALCMFEKGLLKLFKKRAVLVVYLFTATALLFFAVAEIYYIDPPVLEPALGEIPIPAFSLGVAAALLVVAAIWQISVFRGRFRFAFYKTSIYFFLPLAFIYLLLVLIIADMGDSEIFLAVSFIPYMPIYYFIKPLVDKYIKNVV